MSVLYATLAYVELPSKDGAILLRPMVLWATHILINIYERQVVIEQSLLLYIPDNFTPSVWFIVPPDTFSSMP